QPNPLGSYSSSTTSTGRSSREIPIAQYEWQASLPKALRIICCRFAWRHSVTSLRRRQQILPNVGIFGDEIRRIPTPDLGPSGSHGTLPG
ncbi:MAG: hypothetical protein ACKN81_13405, partial [Pirellulaceae bacterium]